MSGGRHGFTLIELLVVIVIIGILAAVAWPAYESQVRKNRRTDGVSAMENARQALIAFRSDQGAFPLGPGFEPVPAEALEVPSLRREALEMVFGVWANKDPSAAAPGHPLDPPQAQGEGRTDAERGEGRPARFAPWTGCLSS